MPPNSYFRSQFFISDDYFNPHDIKKEVFTPSSSSSASPSLPYTTFETPTDNLSDLNQIVPKLEQKSLIEPQSTNQFVPVPSRYKNRDSIRLAAIRNADQQFFDNQYDDLSSYIKHYNTLEHRKNRTPVRTPTSREDVLKLRSKLYNASTLDSKPYSRKKIRSENIMMKPPREKKPVTSLNFKPIKPEELVEGSTVDFVKKLRETEAKKALFDELIPSTTSIQDLNVTKKDFYSFPKISIDKTPTEQELEEEGAPTVLTIDDINRLEKRALRDKKPKIQSQNDLMNQQLDDPMNQQIEIPISVPLPLPKELPELPVKPPIADNVVIPKPSEEPIKPKPITLQPPPPPPPPEPEMKSKEEVVKPRSNIFSDAFNSVKNFLTNLKEQSKTPNKQKSRLTSKRISTLVSIPEEEEEEKELQQELEKEEENINQELLNELNEIEKQLQKETVSEKLDEIMDQSNYNEKVLPRTPFADITVQQINNEINKLNNEEPMDQENILPQISPSLKEAVNTLNHIMEDIPDESQINEIQIVAPEAVPILLPQIRGIKRTISPKNTYKTLSQRVKSQGQKRTLTPEQIGNVMNVISDQLQFSKKRRSFIQESIESGFPERVVQKTQTPVQQKKAIKRALGVAIENEILPAKKIREISETVDLVYKINDKPAELEPTYFPQQNENMGARPKLKIKQSLKNKPINNRSDLINNLNEQLKEVSQRIKVQRQKTPEKPILPQEPTIPEQPPLPFPIPKNRTKDITRDKLKLPTIKQQYNLAERVKQNRALHDQLQEQIKQLTPPNLPIIQPLSKPRVAEPVKVLPPPPPQVKQQTPIPKEKILDIKKPNISVVTDTETSQMLNVAKAEFLNNYRSGLVELFKNFNKLPKRVNNVQIEELIPYDNPIEIKSDVALNALNSDRQFAKANIINNYKPKMLSIWADVQGTDTVMYDPVISSFITNTDLLDYVGYNFQKVYKFLDGKKLLEADQHMYEKVGHFQRLIKASLDEVNNQLKFIKKTAGVRGSEQSRKFIETIENTYREIQRQVLIMLTHYDDITFNTAEIQSATNLNFQYTMLAQNLLLPASIFNLNSKIFDIERINNPNVLYITEQLQALQENLIYDISNHFMKGERTLLNFQPYVAVLNKLHAVVSKSATYQSAKNYMNKDLKSFLLYCIGLTVKLIDDLKDFDKIFVKDEKIKASSRPSFSKRDFDINILVGDQVAVKLPFTETNWKAKRVIVDYNEDINLMWEKEKGRLPLRGGEHVTYIMTAVPKTLVSLSKGYKAAKALARPLKGKVGRRHKMNFLKGDTELRNVQVQKDNISSETFKQQKKEYEKQYNTKARDKLERKMKGGMLLDKDTSMYIQSANPIFVLQLLNKFLS